MPQPIDQIDTIVVAPSDDLVRLELDFATTGTNPAIRADPDWVQQSNQRWIMRRQLLSMLGLDLLDVRLLLRIDFGDPLLGTNPSNPPSPPVSSTPPPVPALELGGYAWTHPDSAKNGVTYRLFGQAHFRGSIHPVVVATRSPTNFSVEFRADRTLLASGSFDTETVPWLGPVRL